MPNTPTGQYDLVTLAMHEMAHSFMSNKVTDDVNTGIGRLRNEGSPGLYDRFVVNGLGQPLIDTTQFPDPSTRLGAQLTGNNLFFNGKNARAANGGTNPRLYAPLEWQQGSSYSHLDEATYGSGNPNSLITPALDSAESIHSPGSIGLGIFQDLGWIDQTLVGNQDQNVLVGDAGNDTLTGLGNSDRLVGLGGSDKIVGGAGNDILIGGIGNSGDVNAQNLTNSGFDTLIGGRGRDRFALEQGTGYAVISDFHDHEDHLSLVHGLSFRNLSASRGSNVAIFFYNDLLAVLKGVQASQLTAADFVKL